MSKTLLRELLLTSGIQPVELPNSTEVETPAVLVYLGKQRADDPSRIEIEEIVPSVTPTILNPTALVNQNPTILVDTSYQDLMGGKVCLDNFIDETISCDGAKHEAYIPFASEANGAIDIFPLLVQVQGEEIIFPAGTTFNEFQERMLTYGVLVGHVLKQPSAEIPPGV